MRREFPLSDASTQGTTEGTERAPRGFAALTPERRRELGVMGGKKAQATGRAHRWTVEEARAAGKKGAAAGGRGRPKSGGEL